MTIISAPTKRPRLRGAEPLILEHLGNTPWQASGLTGERVAEAKRVWANLRAAAGFKPTTGGWVTTSSTSPKLRKSDLPTIGTTLLSAQGAHIVWQDTPEDVRRAIAAAVGSTVERIGELLAITVCPGATLGCKMGCVTDKSHHAMSATARRARLIRNVLTVLRPELAICLLGDQLRKLHTRNPDGARWRVNVSDDIRWELLAPGLFDLGVPGYAYTKHYPLSRPGRENLSVVYSAHEASSVERITEWITAGLRVAVVLDIPRITMCDTWHGMPVSNGDITDDLYTHPAGHIVGLTLKAPTNELKEALRQNGFAKPPTVQPVRYKKEAEATDDQEAVLTLAA